MAITTTGSTDDGEATLRERAGALRDQLGDLRRQVDLEGRIRAHPLPAIGIALALGALIGARRRPGGPTTDAATDVATSAGLGGAITGALTAIALRLLKEAALGQLAGAANTWYGRRHGGPATRPGARAAAAEPFARH